MWTLTTNKLPEINTKVLCVSKDIFGHPVDFDVLFLCEENAEQFWCGEYGQNYDLDKVVAWMPIPTFTE